MLRKTLLSCMEQLNKGKNSRTSLEGNTEDRDESSAPQ